MYCNYFDFKKRFEIEKTLCHYIFTTKENIMILLDDTKFYNLVENLEKSNHNKMRAVKYSLKNPLDAKSIYNLYPNYVFVKQARGYNPQTNRFEDGKRITIYASDKAALLNYLQFVNDNKQNIYLGGVAPTLKRVKLEAEMVLDKYICEKFNFTGNEFEQFLMDIQNVINNYSADKNK